MKTRTKRRTTCPKTCVAKLSKDDQVRIYLESTGSLKVLVLATIAGLRDFTQIRNDVKIPRFGRTINIVLPAGTVIGDSGIKVF